MEKFVDKVEPISPKIPFLVIVVDACGELATKIVKYAIEGAIILEKFAINVSKQLKTLPKVVIQIKFIRLETLKA